MGKKNKAEKKDDSKTKPIKSAKPKNKEMFTELKTHQQKKISIAHHHKKDRESMMEEDAEDSPQVFQKQPEEVNNLEDICAMVNHLLIKNKVSAKNAFEVPFIDLQQLQDFSRIGQSQNGWNKVSSTLENDSKIYSYRVDAIHAIAYRIMNTMMRNQDDPQEEKENPEQSQQVKKQSISFLDRSLFPNSDEVEMSSAQLEKNIGNINAGDLDRGFQYNPNYERTKRQFDQNGVKGILLNSIPMDINLELSLNETRKIKPNGLFEEAMLVKVDEMNEPLNILKDIENSRKAVSSFLKKDFANSFGIEAEWKNIMKCDFEYEEPEGNEYAMRDESMEMCAENNDTFVFKKVQEVVKVRKNHKKQQFKNHGDVAQDGISWLSQMDRKMLGISGSLPTPAPSLKKSIKNIEKSEDDIDFNAQQVLSKEDDVFAEGTMQRLKAETNEELEEKHLLPMKPFSKFKVEQIMTLREQPVQKVFYDEENDQNFYELVREREQMDLKRQQISIRESKEVMKSHLLKCGDFQGLYKKLESDERTMSPQLCFLTILHLANQNNLSLDQSGDFNFLIK